MNRSYGIIGGVISEMFGLAEQAYSEEDAAWDAFVAQHPHGSILQTTHWARLKGRFGWTGFRVWLKHEGQLAAGAQILFKSSAMRLVKIGYVPHGPLVDWQDDEQVDVLFNQIDHAVYRHRAGMVKFEPFIWEDEPVADAYRQQMQRLAIDADVSTIQPPRTMLLDLTPSEDDILARMKQKTRYNVRVAAKKEVTVRVGTAADLPAFIKLMRTTGSRNAFGVHADEYYAAAYEIFSAEKAAAIILAEYNGQPLAGVMAFKWGDKGSYLYGGSSNEERQRMASYAAQWGAIQWAKAQGCTQWDMWGLPDADAATLEAEFKERNDDLWGVYRFKRGWGGDVKRTVGAADKVYNKLVYRMYQRRTGGG